MPTYTDPDPDPPFVFGMATLDDFVGQGRKILTVDETAEALDLKRTATYEAVRRGQLPSLRLGRRLFVPVPALVRLLDGVDEASLEEAV
jgi:excisionase family DNA binding protein